VNGTAIQIEAATFFKIFTFLQAAS